MKQLENLDVIVVGAGPAGMMAAGTAAQKGLRVLLVEKKDRPGRKLMITGKGRCNVTNACQPQDVIDSTPTNGRFLYSALSCFSPADTIRFFEERGVPLKVERGQRVFPQSDKAVDIVDAMTSFVKQSGVFLHTGAPVSQLLLENGAAAGVQLENGETLWAPKVLLACGGASYPGTGSNGDGARLARQAGHTIVPLRPSLVAVRAREQAECQEMQGLSLRNCGIRIFDNRKRRMIYDDFGELLFTHFGLSGPVVLSASAHMRDMTPGRYQISINVKPALRPEALDARVCRDLQENRNRDFSNSLGALLPRKMIPVVVRRSGIPPEEKCNQITRPQRQALVELLQDFRFTVEGFRPIEEAIITSGGVSVKEVNPKTMESKKVPGLYFAGEILDVDAYTGGYNLQIAFSTGRLAAQNW